MQNELKYTVRSREIVDLMSAMKSARLTLSPYFQRNLVWRDTHRREFIDTILKGYPFPQIFLARGPIDLDTMEASQAVVDGQQRLNSIRDFINGKLNVNEKTFKDLSTKEREDFLKYEVAVIDFDLNVDDPRLKDVFHRLNRTFYSLSAIEKLASEYSASEFMLVARVLSGEILKALPEGEESEDVGSGEESEAIPANLFSRDPGVDEDLWSWVLSKAEGEFAKILEVKPIFTKFEFDRKVPLMFTLNIMCTYLEGYYQQNNKVRKYLDERAEFFQERDEVINVLNETANHISRMDLPDESMWWNKANFFSLVCEISRDPMLRKEDPQSIAAKLLEFAGRVPADYALSAREAVARKAQREFRGRTIREILKQSS